MELFQWKPEYEINQPQIDLQHKQLVKMINELYASMKEGLSPEAVENTLEQLLQYVGEHFDSEERAMRDRNYPGYKMHIKIHKDLKEKVYAMKVEQEIGKGVATFQLLNFLSDWLKSHICETDKAFGDYIMLMDSRLSDYSDVDKSSLKD